MAMPIIGTLAILRIIAVWNNFIGPLLYLRDSELQAIAVALLHLEGNYTKNWGELIRLYNNLNTINNNVLILHAPFRPQYFRRSCKRIRITVNSKE